MTVPRKIYVRNNYFFVEQANVVNNYPSKDVFVKRQDGGYLITVNTREFFTIGLLRIGEIFKQEGTLYEEDEWVEFYTKNTGSSQSGGSTNSGSSYDYTAKNYTELITNYPSVFEGKRAKVYEDQGSRWLLNFKPKGYYVFDGNSWVNDQYHIIADEILTVNVNQSALPTGAATEVTLMQVRDYIDTVETKLQSIITSLGTPFQDGGNIGNTSFVANAGTNLNTSALNLEATQQLVLNILSSIKAKTDNLDVALSTRAVTGLTNAELRASPIEITQSNPILGFSTLAEQQTQTDKLNQILENDNFQIQKGLVSGTSIVLKSGRNSNITSSSAPEDVWNGSTVYTGFPTGAPEVLQFFSSNAGDTGVITYFYLATAISTAWQTGTVTLNGTTPVLGVSAYRVHSASYNNGTSFNLGTITCRHSVTTANVFFQIPVGTSQTYVAVYTVPAGSTGFIKKVFANVSTTNAVTLQGALYIRQQGQSPRLRRNFDFSDQRCFLDDDIYLKINEKTDVTIRLTSSSSNTAQVIVGGFELILINEIL